MISCESCNLDIFRAKGCQEQTGLLYLVILALGKKCVAKNSNNSFTFSLQNELVSRFIISTKILFLQRILKGILNKYKLNWLHTMLE